MKFWKPDKLLGLLPLCRGDVIKLTEHLPSWQTKDGNRMSQTRDIDTAGKILVGPLLIPSRIDSCSCYYWLEIQTLWVSYLNPVIFVEVWSCYTSFIKWFHGLKQQAMRRFPRYSLFFHLPQQLRFASRSGPRELFFSPWPTSHGKSHSAAGHEVIHFFGHQVATKNCHDEIVTPWTQNEKWRF